MSTAPDPYENTPGLEKISASALSSLAPRVNCRGTVRVDRDDPNNMERRPCKNAAIPGGKMCPSHGGNTAQQRAKAQLRLVELINPAIATLARVMANPNARDADKIKAADSILDRAGMPRKVDLDVDQSRAILIERLQKIQAEKTAAAIEAGEAPAALPVGHSVVTPDGELVGQDDTDPSIDPDEIPADFLSDEAMYPAVPLASQIVPPLSSFDDDDD